VVESVVTEDRSHRKWRFRAMFTSFVGDSLIGDFRLEHLVPVPKALNKWAVQPKTVALVSLLRWE